jgi:hypothetical protein
MKSLGGILMLINQSGRDEDEDFKKFGTSQDLDYNVFRDFSALCTDYYY